MMLLYESIWWSWWLKVNMNCCRMTTSTTRVPFTHLAWVSIFGWILIRPRMSRRTSSSQIRTEGLLWVSFAHLCFPHCILVPCGLKEIFVCCFSAVNSVALWFPILWTHDTECDPCNWRVHLHGNIHPFLDCSHSIHSSTHGELCHKFQRWCLY